MILISLPEWMRQSMWQVQAIRFLEAVDVLVQLSIIGRLGNGRGSTVINNSRISFSAQLEGLIAELDQPELLMCKLSAERLRDSLLNNATDTQVIQNGEELRGRLRDQMDSIFMLALNSNEKELYSQGQSAFGAEVVSRFPAASYEISESSKCLALGRSTAAVFHLMRALEIALRAVAACLGVSPPTNNNWGGWLKAIRDNRTARNQSGKWSENDFFQDISQRLDSIKDAQRNNTMHVDSIYTEAEAREVFDLTRGFMRKIAARMDEQGMPLA